MTRQPTYRTASITATFTENIDTSTLSTNSFRVTTDGAPVNGTITFSNKTATFKPSLAFRHNTTYSVILTTAIKDEAGNPLKSNYAWSFTTEILFNSYTAVSTGSWPEAVAIGDVNGDGRNDVVITTSYFNDPANDYKIFVFLQNSFGTLQTPTKHATRGSYSNRPTTVAIGDLNNDGYSDVVIGCTGYGIEVFLSNGSTLGTGTFYASSDSDKIRIADLNADGKLDIVGIGWGTNTVSVWRGNGDGTFSSSPAVYAVTHGGHDDLEVGDINNDGLMDIIVMSGQSLVPNLGILTQNASGTFDPAVYYYVSNPITADTLTHGVAVGDINSDNLNDIVVTYGGNKPNANIGIFLQNASQTLNPVSSCPSLDIPEPIVIEDVTGDGLKDVIVLHGGWGKAGIYQQKADGTLQSEELYTIPYASFYNPHGLAVGDINGDGQKDIVIADYNHGLVILYNHYSAP